MELFFWSNFHSCNFKTSHAKSKTYADDTRFALKLFYMLIVLLRCLFYIQTLTVVIHILTAAYGLDSTLLSSVQAKWMLTSQF